GENTSVSPTRQKHVGQTRPDKLSKRTARAYAVASLGLSRPLGVAVTTEALKQWRSPTGDRTESSTVADCRQ
ncbi:hypothetical protein BaRGS_00032782, partial [Batillaria attramentaria]